MSNFPGKWFDFNNHKELRRLRNDMKDTFGLKLQIATSIVIAIVSFFLSEYISEADVWVQILFCVILCVIVLLIFLLPFFIKQCMLKARCNVIIKGKDAISLFDDEIVYNILVACEYYNSMQSIPKNELREELLAFYKLEIEYYISESIKKLLLFSSNCTAIFGNKKNQISKARICNILALIDKLLNNPDIMLDNIVREDYVLFCNVISDLDI